MARRANGEGSIYRRKGRQGWYGSVSVHGQRKIVRADTREEAARRVAELVVTSERGTLVVGRNPALEEFLSQWLIQVVKPRVRKWTYTGYEVIVRRHLVPRLGKVRLNKLAPAQVQDLLNEKLEAGLAPKTVRYIRQVLRTALSEAEKWGLVARHVAGMVDGPRVERNEVEPMTPDEARSFLQAVRGDRLEALCAVALAVGLRQG